MNRPLVLTSEHARHPFRRSLPPRVLQKLPEFEPEVLAAEARAEARQQQRLQDTKDFLLAYCACFVAVSAFLL